MKALNESDFTFLACLLKSDTRYRGGAGDSVCVPLHTEHTQPCSQASSGSSGSTLVPVQMEAMRFPCDVTALRWVLGFVSAVGIAVGQGLEIKTTPHAVARCGENLTLPCEASSSGRLDMLSISWLAKNETVCSGKGGPFDPRVACESAPGDHRLTLTLLDVMPVHQGTYLCKVRSNRGAKSNTTTVTVQDCIESSNYSVNASHAQCWFRGVYPIGSIVWSQGGVPLSPPASTREVKDPRGRYTVSSATPVGKGGSNKPYKCSLWIPSAGKELSSLQLPLGQIQPRSSGGPVRLEGACAVLGMVLFIY